MKTPWSFAGLSQTEYRNLRWPEKSQILRRYYGIRIQDSCFQCGKKESAIRAEEKRVSMPEELQNHPFGNLFWAHRQNQAELETIKKNYPNAVVG